MKSVMRIRGHRIDLRVWRRIRRTDVAALLTAIAILLGAVGIVKKWW
jgi:hypothetical protein